MLHGLLGGEQQAEHVEVELPVEVVRGDLGQRLEVVDPGVIHQNVHFAVLAISLNSR